MVLHEFVESLRVSVEEDHWTADPVKDDVVIISHTIARRRPSLDLSSASSFLSWIHLGIIIAVVYKYP